MTTAESALSDLAARLAGTDASLSTSRRDILSAALQELIEAELTTLIGAAPDERSPERTALYNGHRPKLLSTPAGDVEVAILQLRLGSFFPELPEPRPRVDRALWAVIMTADITGASTRKLGDFVEALGCDSGVSKSTVSRICAGIDADVHVHPAAGSSGVRVRLARRHFRLRPRAPPRHLQSRGDRHRPTRRRPP